MSGGWVAAAKRQIFSLAELFAECLDVVARLHKLAIVFFPALIATEQGRSYGQSLQTAGDSRRRQDQ